MGKQAKRSGYKRCCRPFPNPFSYESILGEHFPLLFPQGDAVFQDQGEKAPPAYLSGTSSPEENVALPDLEFVGVPGYQNRLSNKAVTIEEHLSFVNWLIKQGIKDVKEKLSMRFAQDKIVENEEGYSAMRPFWPMTGVSAIGAMAYCAFKGGKLPGASVYDLLNDRFSVDGINTQSANFAENMGGFTPVGRYPALQGFYDLFGNCRELCLGNDGRVYAVGGSYRDELMHLGLGRRNEMPIVIGDHDIGFRIEKGTNEKNIDRRRLVELIRGAGSPADIFGALK